MNCSYLRAFPINNLVLKKTTNDPQKETKNWQTLLQTGVNSGAPLVVPFMSLLLQIRW